MAVLDTDILVSLLKGTSEAIERIRSLEESGDRISTTVITAYELLKGAYLSSRAQENLTRVRGSISSLRILDLSFVACEEASKIYEDLSKRGKMIGEFDVLIAAIARTYDEPLVSRDAHFGLIRGIKLIKW